MKTKILLISLLFLSLSAFSQKEADSVMVKVPLSAVRQVKTDTLIRLVSFSPDVIIKTNGNMFQCKILEVNDSLIRYKADPKDTSQVYESVPRTEVYAISYSNGRAMVITPELMGKKADIYPTESCQGWDNFKSNLGHGAISVGIGFVNFYSPLKNTSSYNDEQVMPSVFAGYNFRVIGKLRAGAHLGVGGNKLSKSQESVYDQLKVSSTIDEGFICLGLFARYNILDGAIKPFIKGGLDLFYVDMTTTSEAVSLDGKTASLNTVIHQRGIKPGLVLRAGLDLYFGNRFGIYGDVGTGLSLVQVGVLFNLE